MFPIIILKDKDAPIYFFEEKNFGLASKGGEQFYSHGKIYDLAGNCFVIKKIAAVKKASLLDSIRFFQPMKRVELEFESIGTIELNGFKEIIKSHIRQFNKYWIKRDVIDDLVVSISKMNSFEEIIKFLK